MRNAATSGVVLLFAAIVANAQETTGDVRGRVRDGSGAAVTGARIIVTSTGLQGDRRTVTASDGVFQVHRLPPATYRIAITAIGFAPVTLDSVRVQLGRTTGVADVLLAPAAIRIGDVKIVAPPLTVDPTRTTIGATLEARDYAALPSERDYKSLISVLPHINTSYHGDPVNAGGSTGLENMYFIDGVNVTAPLNGASGTSLPYNFIRAVEVRTGGYEAQYGKALGAIVNAVTYTGSNQFDSNAFAFFTHDALASEARAQPVLKETGFYSYDIGGRIGGPIVRDRLWYSAAYNPRFERSAKVLGALGPQQETSTAHIFAGKLTWHPRPGANVEASLFGDPSEARRVFIADFLSSLTPLNRDPYIRKVETGGATVSLRATANVGPATVLEAALTHSTFRDNILAATERGAENIVADFVDGTVAGGLIVITRNDQRRDAMTLRGTAGLGRHSATFGLEYEMNVDDTFFDNPGIGFVGRFNPDSYMVNDQLIDGEARARVLSAYLQDSWRVTHHFTFNPGLRWSSQSLIGNSGRTAQRFSGELQPRLGFNWQIGKSRNQRLFGSYGRYYQQQPLSLATGYYIDYRGTTKIYSGRPNQPGAVLIDSMNQSTSESDYSRQIRGAEVENSDEFSGGYERLLSGEGKFSIRVLHRNLRSTFQQALDSTDSYVLGSAGEGALAFLPRPVRRYSAIEAGFQNTWRSLEYGGSYVLSRNYGNFTGLYSTDVFINNPGNNPGFATIHHRANTTGLLPNDRTHVLKASGTYRLASSITAGVFASWMSGTPLSEMGSKQGFPFFLSRRGTAGRTPDVWDVNLRVALERRLANRADARIVGDILHVGNPRTTVRQDMTHYFNSDENGDPAGLNENYLRATAFQPPMMARIGIELTPRR
jgi:hypothetical protein